MQANNPPMLSRLEALILLLRPRLVITAIRCGSRSDRLVLVVVGW